MDILQFFVAYVISFGLLLVIVLLTHISPTVGGLVDNVKMAALKVTMAAVPYRLSKAVNKCIHYVFYTRNPLVQVLSIFLMFLGNAMYITEVIPVLYAFRQGEHHILLTPVALFVLTLVPYYLSCVSNPGNISSDFEALIMSSVYRADGVIFTDGNHCRTCKLIKPARSKHCNLCGHCVHRFDHHCLWTNNCVGGGNLRYFLLFLITLQIMVAHGALRGLEALELVVRHSGFLEGRTIGIGGGNHASSVNWYILLENVFLQQPGCTLLVTSLILLFVLIALLILYHVMLMANNQTTNERYKIASLCQNEFRRGDSRDPSPNHIQKDNLSNKCHVTRRLNDKTKNIPSTQFSDPTTSMGDNKDKKNNNNNNNNNNRISWKRPHQNDIEQLNTFYDRGLFCNIKEVLFPWSEYNAVKLKLKQNGK